MPDRDPHRRPAARLARLLRRAAASAAQAVLGALRAPLGQVLLAAGGAIAGGVSGFVTAAWWRWALVAVALALCAAAVAAWWWTRRQAPARRLAAGADDAAHVLSSQLAAAAADGGPPDRQAIAGAVHLAGLTLAAASQRDGAAAPSRVELYLAVAGPDGLTLAPAHGQVAGALGALRAVPAEPDRLRALVATAATATWGTCDHDAAVLAAGPRAVCLLLVSDRPLARHHRRALRDLANILRPVVALTREEVSDGAVR